MRGAEIGPETWVETGENAAAFTAHDPEMQKRSILFSGFWVSGFFSDRLPS